MKRFALRLGRVLAALASAGVLLVGSCGESQLAAEPQQEPLGPVGSTALPATVVLEVTCLDPGAVELSNPMHAVTPDGTAVDAWCGDRLEVTAGRCAVRRGSEVTSVPCVRGSAEGARPGRSSGR